jgi:hypothetical protein
MPPPNCGNMHIPPNVRQNDKLNVMERTQSTTIKTLGITISIIAAFATFSNLMGAFAFAMMNPNSNQISEPQSGMEFLWSNYIYMCLIISALGITTLIGGIKLMKFKNWARKLLIVTSLIFVTLLVILDFIMILEMRNQTDTLLFIFILVATSMVISIPFLFIIYYLRLESVKNHFA